MSTKQLKSAKPEIIVAMFVSSTGRCASILMSTIGELERSSTSTQRSEARGRATPSPSTRGEVQPQLSPSVSATISESKPPESSSAPGMSTREGERIGRLGDEAVHERERDRDRDRRRARRAAPREVVDDHAREDDPEAAADTEHGREQADPDLDLLGRELVADDREAEREERAAGAETTRNAISDQMLHATAAPRQPARKSPRLTSSIRSFPNWSPSLPRIGVVTAAETRKPVSTQVVHAVLAPNSSWNVRERREDHRLLQRERVPASVRMPSVTL